MKSLIPSASTDLGGLTSSGCPWVEGSCLSEPTPKMPGKRLNRQSRCMTTGHLHPSLSCAPKDAGIHLRSAVHFWPVPKSFQKGCGRHIKRHKATLSFCRLQGAGFQERFSADPLSPGTFGVKPHPSVHFAKLPHLERAIFFAVIRSPEVRIQPRLPPRGVLSPHSLSAGSESRDSCSLPCHFSPPRFLPCPNSSEAPQGWKKTHQVFIFLRQKPVWERRQVGKSCSSLMSSLSPATSMPRIINHPHLFMPANNGFNLHL